MFSISVDSERLSFENDGAHYCPDESRPQAECYGDLPADWYTRLQTKFEEKVGVLPRRGASGLIQAGRMAMAEMRRPLWGPSLR